MPASTGFDARVELAYSKSAPNIVYASVDTSGGQLFRSTNGGTSFGLVNSGTNFLSGQGWYDNALWVSPTNSGFVIVGGVDLLRVPGDGDHLFRCMATSRSD